MQSVCVFAGSSPGTKREYETAAIALGEQLAQREITLVYGGANRGLMTTVADSALAAGGRVVGVIPDFLQAKEVAHDGLSELRIVQSMHERKAIMSDLADAFIALPGGLGTLEEIMETATWAQLGIHCKPCGILNSAGYFDGLLAFLDTAVSQRFLQAQHRSMILSEDDPAKLLDRMSEYQAPLIEKWLDTNQT